MSSELNTTYRGNVLTVFVRRPSYSSKYSALHNVLALSFYVALPNYLLIAGMFRCFCISLACGWHLFLCIHNRVCLRQDPMMLGSRKIANAYIAFLCVSRHALACLFMASSFMSSSFFSRRSDRMFPRV